MGSRERIVLSGSGGAEVCGVNLGCKRTLRIGNIFGTRAVGLCHDRAEQVH